MKAVVAKNRGSHPDKILIADMLLEVRGSEEVIPLVIDTRMLVDRCGFENSAGAEVR